MSNWKDALESKIKALDFSSLDASDAVLVTKAIEMVKSSIEEHAQAELLGHSTATFERGIEHLNSALVDIESLCEIGRPQFGAALVDFARENLFPVVSTAAATLGKALVERAVSEGLKRIGG